jgi:hypothetical protein
MARSSTLRPRLLAFLLAAAACGSGPADPNQRFEYLVTVNGERFVVRASDPATNRALDGRLRSGKPGIIIGTVAKGDGAFNAPWRWHLVPETVNVADVSIELCDGLPSHVEADVDAWMTSVKSFCPWGAVVASRRPYVPAGGSTSGR